MNNERDFSDYKVGDEVFVTRSYYAAYPAKVEKVLKSWLVVRGNKYRKDGGWQVGGDVWCRNQILPPTEERRARFVREKNISKLKNQNWHDLEDSQLLAVVEILNQNSGEKP